MLATPPLGADRADLRINFFLAKNLFARFSDSEMLFGCESAVAPRENFPRSDVVAPSEPIETAQQPTSCTAMREPSSSHAKSGVPAGTKPIIPSIAAMRCRCKKSFSSTRRQRPTGKQTIWGGILWRSNPQTPREIRVVDHICDLPSSSKGAIKVDEICHNPCAAVRKIVFAL
jgi:hypothetical protein